VIEVPGTKMVLLAEDDPADARLVQRAFLKCGGKFTVVRLTNGDDVIDYMNGRPPYENRAVHPLPNILLLDIKLPRRSGLEVLQWLRARSDALRRVPVVMLTSSRHSVDINRAYELGANSYLAKPDTSSGLIDLVDAFQKYWFAHNEEPAL
jgi:CheY-like chemotaxis protein